MLNNKKNIEIMMTVEMIFKGDDVAREMKREFATAEWSEKRECSVFKSQSLLRVIIERYFDNAESVLSSAKNETFDIYSDDEVVLNFEADVSPIIKPLKCNSEEICQSIYISDDTCQRVIYEREESEYKFFTAIYTETSTAEKPKRIEYNPQKILRNLLEISIENVEPILSAVEEFDIYPCVSKNKVCQTRLYMTTTLQPMLKL